MWSRLFFLAEVIGFAVWALCASGEEAARSGEVTGGPSQAELDRADVEPTQWLTYNKGNRGKSPGDQRIGGVGLVRRIDSFGR